MVVPVGQRFQRERRVVKVGQYNCHERTEYVDEVGEVVNALYLKRIRNQHQNHRRVAKVQGELRSAVTVGRIDEVLNETAEREKYQNEMSILFRFMTVGKIQQQRQQEGVVDKQTMGKGEILRFIPDFPEQELGEISRHKRHEIERGEDCRFPYPFADTVKVTLTNGLYQGRTAKHRRQQDTRHVDDCTPMRQIRRTKVALDDRAQGNDVDEQDGNREERTIISRFALFEEGHHNRHRDCQNGQPVQNADEYVACLGEESAVQPKLGAHRVQPEHIRDHRKEEQQGKRFLYEIGQNDFPFPYAEVFIFECVASKVRTNRTAYAT